MVMNVSKAANFGLALIGLAGCGATTTLAVQDVQPGMTEAQVLSMLGEPRRQSFADTHEAWLYDDAVGFGRCAYVTIWLVDDVVRSLNNFTRGCFGATAPPNWDRMPDLQKLSPDAGPSTNHSKYSDLEQLKKLLDDGALTQEEYDQEKAKILGK